MAVRPVPAATRGPVRIDLDWDALEIAVERKSPDTDSYLDLLTGRVITITTGDPEAVVNRQQVSENIRNYRFADAKTRWNIASSYAEPSSRSGKITCAATYPPAAARRFEY